MNKQLAPDARYNRICLNRPFFMEFLSGSILFPKADMIRLYVLFSFILIIGGSCKPAYRECECDSSNEETNLYSEILNELVEHRFYNLYLGEDEERIFKAYANNMADTNRIRKEVIQLQNQIFRDTARFCILYLDTTRDRKFNSWLYHLQGDTSSYGTKIRSLVREVSNDLQSVRNAVGTLQTKLLPKDLKLCTSAVKMYPDANPDSDRCVIGKVKLSKVFINPTKDRGLLYVEFVCGGLCGYGDLLIIEKVNKRWKVRESHRMWVS